jgi:hypothetical protein
MASAGKRTFNAQSVARGLRMTSAITSTMIRKIFI